LPSDSSRILPSVMTLGEGHFGEFRCESDSVPTWIVNGKKPSPKILSDEKKLLSIFSMKKKDKGMYTCEGMYYVGNRIKRPFYAKAMLIFFSKLH